MEACLCIPWRLLGASILETLKSPGLKYLVNRLSIAGGREMCLVTKTTLHEEPLLIIYTVMYHPAASGMWTLSVNWNVRTVTSQRIKFSQCIYIEDVWKWANKSNKKTYNVQVILKHNYFYGVLFIGYNRILKAID